MVPLFWIPNDRYRNVLGVVSQILRICGFQVCSH